MSKRTFGEEKQCQRDRCLEIAARLKRETEANITPTLVTNTAIKEGLFSPEQLERFQFQGARRLVEQWLKTLDSYGLPMWGQLPIATESGEMAWEKRDEMKLDGYPWNYLLRDDVVVENTITRDRWRDEALKRWTANEFAMAVDRLREERQNGEDVA
jgi:hypothetical protein